MISVAQLLFPGFSKATVIYICGSRFNYVTQRSPGVWDSATSWGPQDTSLPEYTQYYSSRKCIKGPSIKYVTLFWINFDFPPPPCHTLSHISVRHSSRASQFLVVQAYIGLHINVFTGGVWPRRFVWGFLSGRFCLRWFLFLWPLRQNTSNTTES